MSNETQREESTQRSDRFLTDLEKRCRRKAKEARYRDRGFWKGVGVMGLVGWSVILPAVIGGFLGLWIDRQLEIKSTFSGLLAMLGLGIGCWNAWRMVSKVLRHDEEVEKEAEEEKPCE